MAQFSKEFIIETKKEITRLEGLARGLQTRVAALKDLLQEGTQSEAVIRAAPRKKESKLQEDSSEISKAAEDAPQAF